MSNLTLTTGRRFRGQLTDIPDTTRVSNFNSARRLLRVGPASTIAPGDVFTTPGGTVYLIAEHGTQYQKNRILYKHFKLFEMTDQVTVSREGVETRDPITGKRVAGTDVTINDVWVAYEPRPQYEDTLRVPIDRRQVITGQVVAQGDRINNWVVEDVIQQLGVYIVTINES